MQPSETRQKFRIGGGLIDRDRPLAFSFDGQSYRGYAGDTLASALLANGVTLVGRSFKYHRPRGILTAGSEEPNALVELRSGARSEPNTRATRIELYDGLAAKSQNRWPSLKHDLLAVNQVFAPFFSAGFYYKTFMWPAFAWEKIYEPAIRRAAGLGRASRRPDPDIYEKADVHCDVLVVGGGPTGLAAALSAARSGAEVILADEDFRLGGRLLAERATVDEKPASAWAEAAVAELSALPNVRLMPRTTVYGVYDHGTYGAVERVADHLPAPAPFEPRLRGWHIHARRAVLASGAIERPLTFSGNDRPGVMLASAVRTYVNRFAVAPGTTAVVFTSCDDGWRTASDLHTAGVDVAALIDTRTDSLPAPRNAPWRVIAGGSIERTHGRLHLDGVTARDAAGARVEIHCDLLAVSNGWDPALHLTCHLGGKPRWDEARQIFLPGNAAPRGLSAGGAANGAFTLAEALADGARLGSAAARDLGLETKPFAIPTVRIEESSAGAPAWHLPTGRAKAFLDFQNDVTASDAKLALREGYGAVEHLKRYTTLGMATDQGKTGNVAALALVAELTGRPVPEVGTTGFRPPYTPVALGAFAGAHRGRDYRPTRLTPTHAWAEEQGAVFADAGWWLRAQYYRRPGETGWLESVSREVAAVRNGVGLCDVSTLGKVDISGPDAGAFLDRVYVNTFSTLAPGRVRYGLMLREDGFALDDGTVACLSPGHYIITTTTAHAGKVLEHLHFCQQVLWPELDVAIVPVTEQWAQLALAGPRSRDVLARVVDLGCDVSNAVLPFMALTEATIGGVPARIFRVSFSGERAYEIAVPANYGDALARSLMLAGAAYGITPYGTEALNVLRIEKGHPSGPEIDGRTTARDLGLGKLVSAKKDCIGRVLSGREALIAPERPILVGLKALSRSSHLSAGAHLIPPGEPATAEHEQGHVSSVAYSPSLECEIGLGFLKRGRERIGEYIRVVDLLRGRDALCEVVDPVFIDPDGVRLRG